MLGGDQGYYRPAAGPDAAAAARARREAAERTGHRPALELASLQAEGITSLRRLAVALMRRSVLTPRGCMVWTHTTVAQVLSKVDANLQG